MATSLPFYQSLCISTIYMHHQLSSTNGIGFPTLMTWVCEAFYDWLKWQAKLGLRDDWNHSIRLYFILILAVKVSF